MGHLSLENLRSLFPFHILIDGHDRIQQVGHALARVCAELAPGTPLGAHIRLVHPEADPCGSVLLAVDDQPVVLQVIPSRLHLQGQAVELAVQTERRLALLLWPTLGVLEHLDRFGLRPDDLPLHSSARELRFLLQAHHLALRDSRHASEALDRQRAQLERAHCYLAVQHRITDVIARSPLDLPALLRTLLEGLRWQAAMLWQRADAPPNALTLAECVENAGLDPKLRDLLRAGMRDEVAALACRRNGPCWRAQSAHGEAGRDAHGNTSPAFEPARLAVPVASGDQCLGAIELISVQGQCFDAALATLLEDIARRVGAAWPATPAARESMLRLKPLATGAEPGQTPSVRSPRLPARARRRA
jgi:hypothetical protein